MNVSLGESNLGFIFRHFPQVQIHPHAHAQRAAEAAEAAAAQGQFWLMHQMLFIHQRELGDGHLVEYANRLELNIPEFLQDLSQGVYVDRINADIEGGMQSGEGCTCFVYQWNSLFQLLDYRADNGNHCRCKGAITMMFFMKRVPKSTPAMLL